MTDARAIILVLYLLNGALIVGLCIPLILDKVRPNPWYGFRVGRTLKDPAVWYAVNRYAAWRMMAVGLLVMLVATLAFFVRDLSFVAYALACAAVAVLGMTIAVVQTFRYLWNLG